MLETVKGLWVINTNSVINGRETGFKVSKDTLDRVEFHFTMPAIMTGDYVLGVSGHFVLITLYHKMLKFSMVL